MVWGEPGTNGQHAYFQMLHQGTDVVPVEFILVKRQPSAMACADLHAKLLANCLAQAQALMLGKTPPRRRAEAPTASAHARRRRSRASRLPRQPAEHDLLLERLTPRALGALIALYEHRVFTSGALWGINSFDQWGVELGKALCARLLPLLEGGAASSLPADSTRRRPDCCAGCAPDDDAALAALPQVRAADHHAGRQHAGRQRRDRRLLLLARERGESASRCRTRRREAPRTGSSSTSSDIEHELSWTALPRADADGDALESRRIEYLKLQRQAPAITEVVWIDPDGPRAAAHLAPGDGC